MVDELSKTVQQRFKELKEIRLEIEDDWNDICDLVAWHRARLDQDGNITRKVKRALNAYNGQGAEALRVWADGMFGYIVSPSHPWFRLELAAQELNQFPDVRTWLDEVQEHLASVFQHSNFYTAMGQYFYDAGAFGTATLLIEDDPAGRILYRVQHPYTTWVSEDRRGHVDTVYRLLILTARQAEQEFGINALPDALQRAVKDKPFGEHRFIHAVFPNTERLPYRADASGKPWLSVYVHEATGKIVRRSGYNGNPFTVWRVAKDSREVYGRSPAMDAICDIKMANQVSKDLLEASHMSVAPPYNVPREMRGKVHIRPRERMYYDDPQRIVTPAYTRIDYPVGVDREERIERAVRRSFHVDFFLMLSQAEREMTATEVMERLGEKAALMAGQIGRLKDDCLDPLIDRTFDIEMAAGRIPDPPARILEYGGDIDVKYIGPLAQLQSRYQQTQGISQALDSMGPLLVAWPEARHVVDPIKTARKLLRAAGFPQECQRSDEEIAAMIEAEAQQAQAAQMAEAAPKLGTAAKALNQPVQAGSPLERLMMVR